MIQKNSNGFKLLTTRPFKDIFDTETYEKKTGITLPPVYRLFLENFYTSNLLGNGQEWNELKRNEAYLKSEQRFIFIDKIVHKAYEDDFIINSLDINIEVFKDISSDYDLFFEHSVIDCFPIGAGNGVNSPGLFVGIKDYNLDKIYLENSGLRKGKWTLLAENIFEFIRGFEVVEYNEAECKRYKFTYDKLYRNWNEDFWRVREDDKPS